MKKFLFFALILAFFLSCSNPSSSGPTQVQDGQLVVTIPSGTSRGIDDLTSALAQANVAKYAVYIFDPSTSSQPVTASIVPPATSATINASPGSYSVLVSANSAGDLFLLGSGEQKSVTVASGVTTQVSITLNPVHFAFTVDSPPQIGQGSTLGVTLRGNAGIDSIRVSYFYATIYDGVTIDQTAVIYPSLNFQGNPTSEVSYSTSIPLNFVVDAATSAISINGYQPRVVEGSASFGLTQYFFGYGYCPGAINSDFLLSFTPSPTTGVGIGIT